MRCPHDRKRSEEWCDEETFLVSLLEEAREKMEEEHHHWYARNYANLSIEHMRIHVRIEYEQYPCKVGSELRIFFEELVSRVPEQEYDGKIEEPLHQPEWKNQIQALQKDEKEESAIIQERY